MLQRWKRFGVDESYLTDPTLITCLVGIRLTPLLCPECKQPYSGHRASVEPEIAEIIAGTPDRKGYSAAIRQGARRANLRGFVDVQVFLRSLRRIENSCRCTNVKGSLLPGNTGNKREYFLAENLIRLINDGRVDPVMGHSKVCNLDRDETFNEQN